MAAACVTSFCASFHAEPATSLCLVTGYTAVRDAAAGTRYEDDVDNRRVVRKGAGDILAWWPR